MSPALSRLPPTASRCTNAFDFGCAFRCGWLFGRPPFALGIGLHVADRLRLRVNRLGLRIADRLGLASHAAQPWWVWKALSSCHYFSFDFAASRAKRSAFNRS